MTSWRLWQTVAIAPMAVWRLQWVALLQILAMLRCRPGRINWWDEKLKDLKWRVWDVWSSRAILWPLVSCSERWSRALLTVSCRFANCPRLKELAVSRATETIGWSCIHTWIHSKSPVDRHLCRDGWAGNLKLHQIRKLYVAGSGNAINQEGDPPSVWFRWCSQAWRDVFRTPLWCPEWFGTSKCLYPASPGHGPGRIGKFWGVDSSPLFSDHSTAASRPRGSFSCANHRMRLADIHSWPRCARGFHQCYKAGCLRKKPFVDCPHSGHWLSASVEGPRTPLAVWKFVQAVPFYLALFLKEVLKWWPLTSTLTLFELRILRLACLILVPAMVRAFSGI